MPRATEQGIEIAAGKWKARVPPAILGMGVMAALGLGSYGAFTGGGKPQERDYRDSGQYRQMNDVKAQLEQMNRLLVLLQGKVDEMDGDLDDMARQLRRIGNP